MTHRAEIELPIKAAQLKPVPNICTLPPSPLAPLPLLTLSIRQGNGAIRKCECECECEWETFLMMIDLGKHRNIRIQI